VSCAINSSADEEQRQQQSLLDLLGSASKVATANTGLQCHDGPAKSVRVNIADQAINSTLFGTYLVMVDFLAEALMALDDNGCVDELDIQQPHFPH